MFKWALRGRRSNTTQRGHIVQQGMHPNSNRRLSYSSNPYGYNGAMTGNVTMTGNVVPVRRRTMLNRIRNSLGFRRQQPVLNPVTHMTQDPTQGLSNGIHREPMSIEELNALGVHFINLPYSSAYGPPTTSPLGTSTMGNNGWKNSERGSRRNGPRSNVASRSSTSKLQGRVKSRANSRATSRSHSSASLKGRPKNNSPSILRMSNLIETVKEVAEKPKNKDPDEYAVNKLISVNQLALPSIFQELQDGPKVNHYMWWICPFLYEAGRSDDLKTYVTPETYAKFLVNIDFKKWINVLNIIAGSRSIITEEFDIRRIRKFCDDWKTLDLKHWPQLKEVISKLAKTYKE
jgi:hypothetical protein